LKYPLPIYDWTLANCDRQAFFFVCFANEFEGTPIMASTPRTLQEISTDPNALADPQALVLRYSSAILGYLKILLQDENDAQDVSQQFALRMLRGELEHWQPGEGRFRDYLCRCVRNAAWDHLRARRGWAPLTEEISDPASEGAKRLVWLDLWRAAVLEVVRKDVQEFEAAHSDQGNLFHTLLELLVAQPDATSNDLAERLTQEVRRNVTPAGVRKQISRLRRKFAELIVQEIQRTLPESTAESIREEMTQLGVMGYVQPFLPPDWTKGGELQNEPE
jgi:DNA-directed RNA polymerase specialized sigma24 family protein